jgi:broad specificity phosphatase PhoE
MLPQHRRNDARQKMLPEAGLLRGVGSPGGAQTMRWYLLRHAEKEWGGHYNPLLRHQDEPITEDGRRQARAWSRYFADKAIAAVYVSAYQRTRQTAECAAERLGLAPVVDERLNEIDNGLLEGLTEQAFRETYPDVWQAAAARTADFRFPGGETGAEAQARIEAFVADKLRQHAGENLLVICHDGLIRLWMCYALGLPVYRRWDFKLDFCGLTELAYQADAGRWQVVRFNCPPPQTVIS